MQERYVGVHRMANTWFHCGWIEILTLHFWKHYNTHRTYYYIYDTQKCRLRLEDSLQRDQALHFTVYLLTSNSSLEHRNFIWCCILPNYTCNLVKMVNSSLYYNLHYFQNDIHLPWLYTLHFTVHIFQKMLTHDCKNIINFMLCYTIYTNFLWPYIHHASNEHSISIAVAEIWLDILVTTKTHIIPIRVYVTRN
jgi:hypothetical protein